MSRRARVSQLLEAWEEFARELHRGYRFDLDEWLNDVDARRLLEELGGMLPSQQRRLRVADARVQAATRTYDQCLWGSDNAAERGWTKAANWYYFMVPCRHGEDFARDLTRVR